MIWSRFRDAFHFRAACAFDGSATSDGGSPGRRGPNFLLTLRPTIFSISAMTSLTEWAGPGPQIQCGGCSATFEVFETENVCFGKIADVNIIANASAVGRGIVGSENFDLGNHAGGDLQYTGYEMSLRIVDLADFTAVV